MGHNARTLIVAALVVIAAGVAAANDRLPGAPPGPSGAGTPQPASALPTTGSTAGAAGALAIDQIVSITRAVEAGAAAVTAFTVPAGLRLVVTDVLVTNPGAAPACGASVGPGGNGTITGTGAPASSPTAPAESGTGLLCVPAQTSLNVALTTGLEFAAGHSVVLANTTPAAPATPGGPLHYHLRGFLVTPTGS